MRITDGYRLAKVEAEARITAIKRLDAAIKERTVLPDDAQLVISALRGKNRERAQEAVTTANWLLDPARQDNTKAEAERVSRGLPRHLTPLEALSRT